MERGNKTDPKLFKSWMVKTLPPEQRAVEEAKLEQKKAKYEFDPSDPWGEKKAAAAAAPKLNTRDITKSIMKNAFKKQDEIYGIPVLEVIAENKGVQVPPSAKVKLNQPTPIQPTPTSPAFSPSLYETTYPISPSVENTHKHLQTVIDFFTAMKSGLTESAGAGVNVVVMGNRETASPTLIISEGDTVIQVAADLLRKVTTITVQQPDSHVSTEQVYRRNYVHQKVQAEDVPQFLEAVEGVSIV